jgi:hypothetical protein
MKITSISYKKIFPIAQFVNETIGIEIQVDEGDDPNRAFEIAKIRVGQWANEKTTSGTENQTLIDRPHKDEIPVIQVNGSKPNSYYEHCIHNSRTIEQLAEYKPELPKSLMPNYMDKLKELTSAIK